MAYEVIDNFLSEEDHAVIESVMLGVNFPWYFNSEIVSDANENKLNYQLVHSFHRDYGWRSEYSDILQPIVDKIAPTAILRVKANLNPSTSEHYYGGFHYDYPEDLIKCKTAVYYVNTNNGFTEFASGEKVESVANRWVCFDSDTLHSGVTCTDQKVRCLININYI